MSSHGSASRRPPRANVRPNNGPPGRHIIQFFCPGLTSAVPNALNRENRKAGTKGSDSERLCARDHILRVAYMTSMLERLLWLPFGQFGRLEEDHT